MISRLLNIPKTQSFFLFGARGVGKSTYVNSAFRAEDILLLNLLDADLHTRLLASPNELSRIISPALKGGKWVVIDEVQKVPSLLDLVHHHIEQDKAKFALTGSSARKLRRGASNLLAGRAFTFKLYPLHLLELRNDFSLHQALRWGTLPGLLKFQSDSERSLFLQSYATTYLNEEIVAEQIIRKLPPFLRFLQVAAQMNGNVVNFAALADESRTSATNVKNYFQVLEDTLLGFLLEPFNTSIRSRVKQSPKFYFVDCGILRALARTLDSDIRPSTFEYGRLFETFVINQIRAFLDYSLKQYSLSFCLTNSKSEVDLIIERAGEPTLLIEIKSSTEVRDAKLVGLKQLAKDIKNSKPICLCQTPRPLLSDGVEILPWQNIFEMLS